jgi:hypothetical protein
LQSVLQKIEKIAIQEKIPNLKILDVTKDKKSRSVMCTRLEFLFRILNNNSKKLWFYKGKFLSDSE